MSHNPLSSRNLRIHARLFIAERETMIGEYARFLGRVFRAKGQGEARH